MPRFLAGMEFSGVVRRAMRAIGIEAWSCDLLPALDSSPFHIQGNVFDHLDDGWDGAIFHLECTYLTNSAEWAYSDPDYARYPGVGYHQKVKPGTLVGAARRGARERALDDARRLLGCGIPLVGLENPRGAIGTRIRPADQIIQPNWFGDDASKWTCLWLRGWPKLAIDPALRVPGRMVEWPRGSGKMVERWANQTDGGQNKLTPSDDRWADRSITYAGIARAIAQQWSSVMLGEFKLAAE
jgi:hypothetical protein